MLIVGAVLGQMKLTKPQAANAGELFGLSKSEVAMLNEVPMRGTGTPMPPTDPLIYRFYEMVMVNGPAWKALIEEEFGDGIMSAIDFDFVMERVREPEGRPRQDHDVGQIPAVQILRRHRQRAGVRLQGGVTASAVIPGRASATRNRASVNRCHRLIPARAARPGMTRLAARHFPAFTWATASASSSFILARISACVQLDALGRKILLDLAQHVVVAGFLEVRGDDLLGIGGCRVAA